MQILHWLDASSYEGSDPAHLIVDRTFNWTVLEQSRFRGWPVDQITGTTQLTLNAAEPFWQFEIATPHSVVKPFALATAETEFATQLAESLFWCGWDQQAQFDTSAGVSREHFRLGGLPRNLAQTEPCLAKFVPVRERDCGLVWAAEHFSQGYMPIPVGRNLPSFWQGLGFTMPTGFTDDLVSTDAWHDAIWEWCSTVDRWQVFDLYRTNLNRLIDRVINNGQSVLFVEPPRWAKNTQRLWFQYQRGRARWASVAKAAAALV